MLLEINVFAILENIPTQPARLSDLSNLCNIKMKHLIMYGMTLL